MALDMTSVQTAYASQQFVYFDIETIPCQDKSFFNEALKNVSAPSRYSKPESIEKWLKENREKAAKEAVEKTSFDGGRGHVCTIAWAKNEGDIMVCHAETISDERMVLSEFFSDLDPYHSETLVGHNITGFDLGFLRKRAICLGVKMPAPNSFPRDPKPWDTTVIDTMTAWAGGKGQISMNELCEILGIDGKDGFDGSMVAQAWADGEHKKIAEYCADDVLRTREIHKRFLAAGL